MGTSGPALPADSSQSQQMLRQQQQQQSSLPPQRASLSNQGVAQHEARPSAVGVSSQEPNPPQVLPQPSAKAAKSTPAVRVRVTHRPSSLQPRPPAAIGGGAAAQTHAQRSVVVSTYMSRDPTESLSHQQHQQQQLGAHQVSGGTGVAMQHSPVTGEGSRMPMPMPQHPHRLPSPPTFLVGLGLGQHVGGALGTQQQQQEVVGEEAHHAPHSSGAQTQGRDWRWYSLAGQQGQGEEEGGEGRCLSHSSAARTQGGRPLPPPPSSLAMEYTQDE